MGVYADLGVRTVINAAGTLTRLGGSRMAPEVAWRIGAGTEHPSREAKRMNVRATRGAFLIGGLPLLFPVPEAAVAAALRATGRGELADRLTGELIADAARLREIGWTPVETTEEALAVAARAARPDLAL